MHGPAHTVALVSGASPSRAAVFTSSPQSVEIYERGAWWPGSMLGWRHDSGGTCQAWVRVEFAGVVEDAWVDLTLLRLPESSAERHLALAREPKGAAAVSRGTRAEARAEAAPGAPRSPRRSTCPSSGRAVPLPPVGTFRRPVVDGARRRPRSSRRWQPPRRRSRRVRSAGTARPRRSTPVGTARPTPV